MAIRSVAGGRRDRRAPASARHVRTRGIDGLEQPTERAARRSGARPSSCDGGAPQVVTCTSTTRGPRAMRGAAGSAQRRRMQGIVHDGGAPRGEPPELGDSRARPRGEPSRRPSPRLVRRASRRWRMSNSSSKPPGSSAAGVPRPARNPARPRRRDDVIVEPRSRTAAAPAGGSPHQVAASVRLPRTGGREVRARIDSETSPCPENQRAQDIRGALRSHRCAAPAPPASSVVGADQRLDEPVASARVAALVAQHLASSCSSGGPAHVRLQDLDVAGEDAHAHLLHAPRDGQRGTSAPASNCGAARITRRCSAASLRRLTASKPPRARRRRR